MCTCCLGKGNGSSSRSKAGMMGEMFQNKLAAEPSRDTEVSKWETGATGVSLGAHCSNNSPELKIKVPVGLGDVFAFLKAF